MRISLKWILFAGVIGLLVISVSIILASSYLTSQKVLLGHARDIMENIVTFTIQEAQHYLDPARDAAELTEKLAFSDVVGTHRTGNLERYFYEQLRLHANFAGIYIGFPNGDFFYVNRMAEKAPAGFRTKVITAPAGVRQAKLIWRDFQMGLVSQEIDLTDSFDPRQRPWYLGAESARQTVWTDPYIFYTSQKPGLTVASPVYGRQGQLTGVVGVDIEIDELSRFLAQLKIGQRGKAFIINKNKDLVAFPDLDQIRWPTGTDGQDFRLTKIEELDDILAFKAFRALEKPFETLAPGDQVFGAFEHEGRRYHTMFSPFVNSKLPWLIGIYLPEDDYLGSLKANRTQNIYIMLAIAGVGSLAGYLIVKGIARSMAALEKEAQAIEVYDLMTTYEKRSIIREVQAAVDAFSQMKVGLARYQQENMELAEGLKVRARELQLKELQLRSTLTTLINFSDALIVLDRAHCIRFLNPEAERLLNVRLEAVIDQPFMYPLPEGQSSEIKVQGVNGVSRIAEMRLIDTEWEEESAVLVALRDISERRLMEQEAQELYRRAEEDARTKSVLLKEINHRVTNNLSAIIGLLYAERRYNPARNQAEFKEALNNVIHQIQGLATVHDLLSASGWRPLPLNDLTDKVIKGALKALPRDKTISVEITPLAIGIAPEIAASLAIIVNECATNSIKYALTDRNQAKIEVQIDANNNQQRIHVTYRDDGPGYPPEVLGFERHNTGLYLIKSIVTRELGGDLELRNEKGAVTGFSFGLSSPPVDPDLAPGAPDDDLNSNVSL